MTSPIYYYMRDRIPESLRNKIYDTNKQITLQNKCISILHKSQFTHNNTVTKLFTISYSEPNFIKDFEYNTIHVLDQTNINAIICAILLAAETVTKHKHLKVTMAIYTINNIDYRLLDNINVLDMLATKKEILLSSSPEIQEGINTQIYTDNYIPLYIIPLLKLIATLNKIRTPGDKPYIHTYYKSHNLTPTKFKWLPLFIGKKKAMCVNHCISNIITVCTGLQDQCNATGVTRLDKNIHSKQKTNTQIQHISIV